MHIEIRVPEGYDTGKTLKKIRRELLNARVSLKEVSHEVVRSDCGMFEGESFIYAIIYSNSHEKALGWHSAAEKALQKLHFKVKSKKFWS